ncbi:Uncharacterized protein Rs2_40637 [Raphanus sativus]|nr:Uncharacterized protein Rs2_40637 [Raphanus sativus]
MTKLRDTTLHMIQDQQRGHLNHVKGTISSESPLKGESFETAPLHAPLETIIFHLTGLTTLNPQGPLPRTHLEPRWNYRLFQNVVKSPVSLWNDDQHLKGWSSLNKNNRDREASRALS